MRRILTPIGIQLVLCTYNIAIYRIAPKDVKRQRRVYLGVSVLILLLHIMSAVSTSSSLARTLTNGPGKFENYFESDKQDALGDICKLLINFVGDGLLVSLLRTALQNWRVVQWR
jgi:hypothetical protein